MKKLLISSIAALGLMSANVRFWHKADISIALTNVRFRG
jgi:hypothetical protein